MIAYVSALVGLLGLVLYLALNTPTSAKLQQVGLWMFITGLFVTLWHLAGHAVRVLPP